MKLDEKTIFNNLSVIRAIRRLKNRSGQAMIEYVLILIISVTMLFLAKGLFSSLNNYMSSYVGGYFKCLMVQGELPALGVSDSDLSKHTSSGYKCSVKYEAPPASNTTGGPIKNVGTAEAISVKGSTKATAASRGGSTSAQAKKSKKQKASSSGNGGGDSDDSIRFSAVKNRSEPYSTADTGEEDSGSVRSVPMAKSSYDDRPEKYRSVSGQQQKDILKNTRGSINREPQNKTKIISASEDDMRPGPRRNKLNPPTRALATIDEEPEAEMGFGYFLKWIMIAGIGIAIFIFFGGQIMNYTNSDSN